ncbi:copper transpport protein, variant 2 [Metarhizium acridum]|uniref:copper transpport protein, variant 2 n=1 Tax=Metarhizium acridum TaxID=92637 RepID=UPI001C6B25D2|nr:copper transpport protein, variant 2 [Metarhizium acridum]
MNHAGMDHGDMGHGDHGGMEDMCSMSMLFTWDTTNLCIVFRQWHIRSTPGLIFSLVAVVLLAMGYEALRALSRRFEASVDRRMSALPRKSHIFALSPPLSPHFSQCGYISRSSFTLIASYFPHAMGSVPMLRLL